MPLLLVTHSALLSSSSSHSFHCFQEWGYVQRDLQGDLGTSHLHSTAVSLLQAHPPREGFFRRLRWLVSCLLVLCLAYFSAAIKWHQADIGRGERSCRATCGLGALQQIKKAQKSPSHLQMGNFTLETQLILSIC